MEVKRIHNIEDGEEGDYDAIIVNGKDIGSDEQLTWTDIFLELGFVQTFNPHEDGPTRTTTFTAEVIE